MKILKRGEIILMYSLTKAAFLTRLSYSVRSMRHVKPWMIILEN